MQYSTTFLLQTTSHSLTQRPVYRESHLALSPGNVVCGAHAVDLSHSQRGSERMSGWVAGCLHNNTLPWIKTVGGGNFYGPFDLMQFQFTMQLWIECGELGALLLHSVFPATSQKHTCRWTGDTKLLQVCVCGILSRLYFFLVHSDPVTGSRLMNKFHVGLPSKTCIILAM